MREYRWYGKIIDKIQNDRVDSLYFLGHNIKPSNGCVTEIIIYFHFHYFKTGHMEYSYGSY